MVAEKSCNLMALLVDKRRGKGNQLIKESNFMKDNLNN